MTHKLLSLILSITSCLLVTTNTHAAEKPNIVIIVADDLGWADVSFHGTQIKTPNLDRLVAEGAELNRFYVCPVCSPTRAGLMTGRYPIRFGLMRAVVPPWRKGGLDTAETTLPQVLATAGYRHRGAFGKWHLGHSDARYHPLRRGFTEFVGHYNGAIDYFDHTREGELDWHHNFDTSYDKGYSTDLIAAAAAGFINRHAKEESPFLCYVPFNAPHSPLQAKKEDLKAYEHLADVGPKYGRKSGKGKKKITKQKSNNYGGNGRGKSQRQTLAAMISSMDQGVGKILDAIDKNNISNNTLVWFFSDNGGVGTGDNRPLRGAKGSVFGGGIRVAAAVRWPNHIPAGSKVTAPLAYIDVLPTLMQITGIDAHNGKPLDGIKALNILSGKQKRTPRDIYSYIGQQGENTEKITLIETNWKLVINGRKITDNSQPLSSREVLLFQIKTDPYEITDLSKKHPDIVEQMLKKLKTFRDLQPPNAVPPYNKRDPNFKAPKEWKIVKQQ